MAAEAPASLRTPFGERPTARRFNVFAILKDHYRAGYSRPLLWFDLLPMTLLVIDVVTLLVIDVVAFLNHRATISLAGLGEVIPASGSLGADLVQVLLLVLVMMVIVPALIAVLRIGGWLGSSFGGPLSAFPNHVLVFHCFVCLISATALVVGHALEILSGQTESGHYLFESSLYNTLVRFEVLKWVFFTLGGGLVIETAHALIAYAVHGEEFANPVKQYLVRAELADLPAEWLPIASPADSGIGPSQNQPRVKVIQEAYARKLGQLRGFPGGTRESIRLLKDEMANCEGAIRRHLFECPDDCQTAPSDGPSVRFFVGYNRAFEAALSHATRPRTLVATPFLSPSVAALLRWFAFQTGDALTTIQFSPADYLRLWEEQESKILERFLSIEPSSPGSIVFVVSEVYYASGRRIPLLGFLERLRAARNHKSLHIVVDATNAVANDCLIQPSAAWDFCVFSADRWLMAAESCGVLLSRKDLAGVEAESPGMIRPEARNAEPQFRALAAIASAMEAIGQQSGGIQFFSSRCKRLREELRRDMPPTTQIVGAGLSLDETFVMAFCPRDEHKWRFDNAAQLGEALLHRGVRASVVNLDPRCPWLRMALPFYLDAREISRAAKFLKEATS